jgi:hypothetical protein
MLSARITLPHFSVSSEMKLPKSAGVIDFGMLPTSANRDIILGIGEGRVDRFVKKQRR